MRTLSLILVVLVSACASTPPPQPDPLLADHLFAAPTERIGTDHVLQMTDAMRRYLAVDIADQIRTKGPQVGLVDALYRRGQLKLEYDAASTKTAAEAFDARSGNCLSLVVMTAALANSRLPLRVQVSSR